MNQNEVKWTELLDEAVNKPGSLLEAYRTFHGYSIGNQILALMQCRGRGIAPGPISTYPKWKSQGRQVRKGERAITLCMPITCKKKSEDEDHEDECFTRFVYRNRWFVLSQTEGPEVEFAAASAWNQDKALEALGITLVPFEHTDGNTQGYAMRERRVSVSPLAQAPVKTLFHELAHVLLGHTEDHGTLSDGEKVSRSWREAEAEAVALICSESLDLDGAEFCRGYIQNWIGTGNTFPEKSARKVFATANKILEGGV